MSVKLPSRLPPTTEKQWQAQVVDLAHMFDWATYHAWLSVRSSPGWPDLAICRPPRLILAELKTEHGKLTDPQRHWLGLLGDCPGIETYVWRPAQLEDVARILR